MIKAYFSQKFLQKPYNTLKIPKMLKDSAVITKEWLALMCLSSKDIHQNDILNLKYSSLQDGMVYKNFANALLEAG